MLMEKEMATHSSVLAWRIPGTGEPGGLPSMGSHRVGHNWSDLAASSTHALGSLFLFSCRQHVNSISMTRRSSLPLPEYLKPTHSCRAGSVLTALVHQLPFPQVASKCTFSCFWLLDGQISLQAGVSLFKMDTNFPVDIELRMALREPIPDPRLSCLLLCSTDLHENSPRC